MAIKGQGAILSVATALSGSAITATGATNAKPCVVTAANTLTAGAVVVATAFNGITGLNNRAFIASPVTSSAITLKGVDTTNTQVYGTYASGGSLQAQTMTPIGQVKGLKGFDGTSAETDTTHLRSVGKEFFLGLQDGGTVTADSFLDNTDAGQQFLIGLLEGQIAAAFTIQLSNGATAAFMAFIKSLPFDGVQPDAAVTSSIAIRITGAVARFA